MNHHLSFIIHHSTLVFTILATLLAIPTEASAYDFSAVAPSGQTLYYNIVDNTVTVTSQTNSYPYYSTRPTGDITIPDNVEFNNVIYPVTAIGTNAFGFCSDITSVTVPSSVTIIGADAFSNCYNIESINILGAVTYIGNEAFISCNRLSSFTIPNTVSSIGREAFTACYDLTSIFIPASVTSIGYGIFSSCHNLASITVDENNPVYDSRDNCNAIIKSSENVLVSGCQNTIIPNSVTAISNNAFEGLVNLTAITIPTSVVSIGSYAFYASGLTSIDIPSSVSVIEQATFLNCYSLASISFSSSLTTIKKYAFQGCSALTTLTIPNNITSIEESAFGECGGLTSIVVSEGNPNYDSRNNCNAIIETSTNTLIAGSNNTVIPSDVTSLGKKTFFGCHFTSFTIPASVSFIDDYALFACYNLNELYIQAEVPPTLGEQAFFGMDINTPVYVPCGSLADYRAAYGWSQFTNIQEVFNYTVSVSGNDDAMGTAAVTTDPTCANNSATITATPDCGYRFVRWENAAGVTVSTDNPCTLTVSQDTTLTAVFETLQAVDYAESPSGHILYYRIMNGNAQVTWQTRCDPRYTNLNGDLVIPDSVTLNSVKYKVASIRDSAFFRCTGLTSVVIPNTVSSIGDNAFEGCSNMASVTIPNSVTYISTRTFCGSGLTSVTIPNSVTVIGRSAFHACGQMASVIIPNSVTSIDMEAFRQTGLTSVTIPNSVRTIGGAAFAECPRLESVTLPDSITELEFWVLMGCSSLSSITIPSSVTSIDIHAFSWSGNVTSIVVESGNEVYDSRENCNAIIETASNKLFIGCMNTVIPNTVTSIGDEAFDRCFRLSSITIPSSVTSIGNSAFTNCTGLTEITTLATTPPTLGSDVFSNVPTDIPVYVPCGSLASYQAADGWSNFTNIQIRTVDNLAASNVLRNTATLSWTDNANTGWNVEFDAVDFVPGTGHMTPVHVTDTFALLTGLDSATTYHAYVYPDCSTEINYRYVTFTTLAASPATVPYSCDFELDGANGWDLVNDGQANYWMVGNDVNNGGSRSLYITNDGATNAYTVTSTSYSFATRTFSLAAGNYFCSYDWKAQGESSYDFIRVALVPIDVQLTAGNYSGFNNTSAVPAGSIALDSSYRLNLQENWQNHLEEFAITTPGLYKLVFLWRNDGSVGTQPPAAIDNVVLDTNSCPHVNNVTAIPTDNSINLTWSPGGTETSWRVTIGNTSVVMDAPAYTATGLEANTPYTIRVYSLCGIGDTGRAYSLTARTKCSPLPVPYTEDFESYESGSDNPISPCWTKGTNNNTAYPYPYESNAVSGQRSLYFYAYQPSSATSTAQYSYAALPLFQQPVNTLQLSFKVRRYATVTDYYTTRLVIGVMTDPTDISTFFPMDTLDLKDAAASSVHEYEYSFSNYSGNGQYIAIYDEVPPLYAGKTYSYSDAYVDDILVETIPSCPRVRNLAANNVMHNTATLFWSDSTNTGWNVEFGSVDFVPGTGHMTPVHVTDTFAILTGLDSATTYHAYVYPDCGTEIVYRHVTFTTLAASPATVPYSCNFELDGVNGWDLVNGSQANYWMVGNNVNNGGSRSLYITNDGAANAYTITSTSYSFAARAFDLAAGNYFCTYDWKAQGESSYDFIRAALVPIDVQLTAGNYSGFNNTSALPAGSIALDGSYRLNLQENWQNHFEEFTVTTPGLYKLVFLWRNDNVSGTQPPAAIDNVVLTNLFPYSLSVYSADSTMGSAAVTTEPTWGNNSATITAYANSGYLFDHWSDGNTDNPRTISVTSDSTLTALFTFTGSTSGSSDPSPSVSCGEYQWPAIPSPAPGVQIKQKHDHTSAFAAQGWDTVVTLSTPTIELSCMPYIPVQRFNGQYTVDEIPYNPADTSFHAGTRMPISTDDNFAQTATNIPFPFYFFGEHKTAFVIGANGMVSFNPAVTGQFCAWSYSAPLPWPDGTTGAPNQVSLMRDAIYGVYEDTYPNPSQLTGNDGIYYGIQDDFPGRKIVCSWNNIPLFSCTNNRSSYQIVCYEGTNIIEVHVKQRQACPGFNGGHGIIGIQNATGQPQVPSSDPTSSNGRVVPGSPAAFWPEGKNLFSSDLTETAYRFTPQGSTVYGYKWYRVFDDGRDSVELTTAPDDPNGYYIPMDESSTCPTLTRAVVSPTEPAKYAFELRFRNANGDWYFLNDTCTVGVNFDTAIHIHMEMVGDSLFSQEDLSMVVAHPDNSYIKLSFNVEPTAERIEVLDQANNIVATFYDSTEEHILRMTTGVYIIRAVFPGGAVFEGSIDFTNELQDN